MSDGFQGKAQMLENRLRKRSKHLARWARREGTDCFRVYDRDIPEIPLAVDRYGEHAHISVWERDKRGVDDDDEDAWVAAMVAATAAALSVPEGDVAVKWRARQKGSAQYERAAATGRRVTVSEGGHRFWVNLWDYLDTGLFLDHRKTRALVAAESEGKRVLNLFAYTGSFGVYAAGAGARRLVQVDLSNTYLDWARDNLALNELVRAEDELVRADAMPYLHSAAASRERFDLVVVDPPTFSNSKRAQDTFDVRRDHGDLLRAVRAVLAPDGAVYFSTNARGFTLDPAVLDDVRVEDLTEQTRSPDFEGRHSHRAWRLSR